MTSSMIWSQVKSPNRCPSATVTEQRPEIPGAGPVHGIDYYLQLCSAQAIEVNQLFYLLEVVRSQVKIFNHPLFKGLGRINRFHF